MSGCNSESTGTTSGSDPTSAGNSGASSCRTINITSQTVVTSPANRSRTKIGVGEEVTLTATPGPADWNITSGAGSIFPTNDTTVTFRAGEKEGSVTITATGSGGTGTITFTVIKPTCTMRQYPGTRIRHTLNRPDCGFLGEFCLLPDDVSFIHVEVRERNSRCVATGWFSPFNNCTHQPEKQTESAWFTTNDCVAGKGTPANLQDQIYSGDPGVGPPFSVGRMRFPIDWEYRVWGGAVQALPSFEQVHTTDANGVCDTSKGGTTKTARPSDPTSAWL